jgi:hypothetical protein
LVEWTSLAESGHFTYRIAVLRDGPEDTQRVYVQYIVRRDAKRFWELVHNGGAWLYISECVHFDLRGKPTLTYRSSNRMPAGVRAALVDIAQAEGRGGGAWVCCANGEQKGESLRSA